MPQKIYDTISAWSQQNLNSLHVNNKGADQTALLRSQISTFFIHSPESISAMLPSYKIII